MSQNMTANEALSRINQLYMEGNLSNALDMCNQFVAHVPGDLTTHYLRSLCLYKSGQAEKDLAVMAQIDTQQAAAGGI